jgi:predicted phosphodiesterase
VDVVLNCGDSISHKEVQIEKFMELQRRYIQCPIVQCMGNHDFWDSGESPDWYDDRMRIWDKMYKKYNVLHPSECPKIGEFNIVGIDGWYHSRMAVEKTNDIYHIGTTVGDVGSFKYLREKAEKDLQDIIHKGLDRDKTLYMTHFSPFIDNVSDIVYSANPDMAEKLVDNFKWVCTGHTHRYKNEVIKGTTILNCGSNYNEPKFIIIEMH